MAIKYFGPGGQSVTLGSESDKWAGLSTMTATIDSFKNIGNTKTPVYFDENGIPQPTTGSNSVSTGARVVVYVAENTTVTCTDSDSTVIDKKTADSTMQVYFDVGYGTYTFSIPSNVENINVSTSLEITEMKIYQITLSGTGNHHLTVTAEAGAVVTVINDTIEQTKTIADDATSVTFDILKNTAQSIISAVKNGGTSSTDTVTFADGEIEKAATVTFAKLIVKGTDGMNIVASKDSYSFSHTFTVDNVRKHTIYLPSLGTWNITATYSTNDTTNVTVNQSVNVTEYKEYNVSFGQTVYAFYIDSAISDPEKNITYLKDCAGYTPAKMNYNTNKFDWGSWNKDEFFMPRPCMLKYDGTVDYYLDPDDYTLKEDGTASDVSDTSYEGNAMMEWGRDGEKIWYKIVPSSDNDTSATIYIANDQVDSDYHAWSFYNADGEMADHFYTPIYNGSLIDGKMRSISGQATMTETTVEQEVQYAEANNPGDKKMWYTEVYADIILINLLLVLIGKSTDTQTTFGYGYCSGGVQNTGQMNACGMFYGSTYLVGGGVKVFGMENWWGNVYRRYAGHIKKDKCHFVKLTYGKQDGSTVEGYNTTGDGYLNTSICDSDRHFGCINKHTYSNIFGMIPSGFYGNLSNYYSDLYSSTNKGYPLRGGGYGSNDGAGAFCLLLLIDSLAYSDCGAAISCKP